MSSNIGVWYRCKWCKDGLVGVFPDGGFYPDGTNLPPGTVCHSKPASTVGTPNSVRCVAYNRRSAQQVADAYVNETPIDAPESFEPILPVSHGD